MAVQSLSYSLLLHTALLLIIGLGLPMFFERETEFQPTAISVEILPVKDISNIPKSQLPVKKQESTPKPVEKKKAPKPKPVSRDKPEPKPEPVPLPSKDVKAKEKPKPKEKSKPKKDDEFDQLLKDLTERSDSSEAKETPKKATDASTKSRSDSYDPTIPLSISEKDAIRGQFVRHWRLPAGVKNDYTLLVTIDVWVSRDGSVQKAKLSSDQLRRYRSEPAFRSAADSAMRAVKLASPLKNLNPAKYDTWKEMSVNFDPKEMLY